MTSSRVSREHIHTTDKEQEQIIPSEADKATRQIRAGPLFLCYWDVTVFVHVGVFVYICFELCICFYASAVGWGWVWGGQMNKGTLFWELGHPVLTLSPLTLS